MLTGRGRMPLLQQPGTAEYAREVRDCKARLAGMGLLQHLQHAEVMHLEVVLDFNVREPGWDSKFPMGRFITLDMKVSQ